MISRIMIYLIRVYQLALSPYFGQQCRFFPTCSQYAMIAIGKYGALKGLLLVVKRILRCNPWCGGGHDPVP